VRLFRGTQLQESTHIYVNARSRKRVLACGGSTFTSRCVDVPRMAGNAARIGCHAFRATGLTAYLN